MYNYRNERGLTDVSVSSWITTVAADINFTILVIRLIVFVYDSIFIFILISYLCYTDAPRFDTSLTLLKNLRFLFLSISNAAPDTHCNEQNASNESASKNDEPEQISWILTYSFKWKVDKRE